MTSRGPAVTSGVWESPTRVPGSLRAPPECRPAAPGSTGCPTLGAAEVAHQGRVRILRSLDNQGRHDRHRSAELGRREDFVRGCSCAEAAKDVEAPALSPERRGGPAEDEPASPVTEAACARQDHRLREQRPALEPRDIDQDRGDLRLVRLVKGVTEVAQVHAIDGSSQRQGQRRRVAFGLGGRGQHRMPRPSRRLCANKYHTCCVPPRHGSLPGVARDRGGMLEP